MSKLVQQSMFNESPIILGRALFYSNKTIIREPVEFLFIASGNGWEMEVYESEVVITKIEGGIQPAQLLAVQRQLNTTKERMARFRETVLFIADEAMGFALYSERNLWRADFDRYLREIENYLQSIRGIVFGFEQQGIHIPTILISGNTDIQGFIKFIENQQSIIEEHARKRKSKKGFVYLVKQLKGAYYKIGKAKNVKDRVKSFGVKLPFEVEIVHSIECDDYNRTEKVLHKLFKDRRVDGEWFTLSPENVDYIKSISLSTATDIDVYPVFKGSLLPSFWDAHPLAPDTCQVDLPSDLIRVVAS